VRRILPIIGSGLLLLATVASGRPLPSVHHELTVELDPERSRVEVIDVVRFEDGGSNRPRAPWRADSSG
jgi:hypothetical protein